MEQQQYEQQPGLRQRHPTARMRREPSTANLEEAPSAPVRDKGTFAGVFKPVLFTQWGVLIFVRFSVVVGYAGWGLALGFIFLSLLAQTLTTLSLCAVMSNNPPKNSRIMGVFSANVGQSVAAVICLMYYLALTSLSQVELLGAIQAANYVMVNTPNVPDNFTGSPYWDQVAIGVPLLTIVVAMRAYFVHAFHIFGFCALISVIISLVCGIIGLFLTLRGWQVDEARGITGLNSQVLWDNRLPNFTAVGNDESLVETSPQVVLGLIYPSFIGVFQGANTASTLRDPSKSIIKGTLAALAVTSSLYALLFILFASVALRNTLKTDILLFSSLAWPSEYVGYAGAMIVGLGSCAELLELGPTVLQAIARARVFSFFNMIRLDQNVWDEPFYAILVSFTIQLGLVFLGSEYFDVLATLVAIWILFAYATMHLALFLNEMLRMASWRPTFKYYHWSLALLGFIITIGIAIYLSPPISFATFIIILALLFILKIVEEPKASGLGTRHLQISIALRFLLSEEFLTFREEESETHRALLKEHRFWTPQILCFVEMDRKDGSVMEPKLFDFLHQLQSHSRVVNLTLMANILVPNKDDNNEIEVLEAKKPLHDATSPRENLRKMVSKKAQFRKILLKELIRSRIEGFPEVVTAPTVLEGRSILIQSLGIGALRPNLVIMCFSEELETGEPSPSAIGSPQEENAWSREGRLLIQLFDETSILKKACIVIKGIRNFPETHDRLIAGSTIDVWWIIHTGGLQLLLGHLLRLSKVWRKCKLRLFVPVLPGDDEDNITTEEGVIQPSLFRLLETQRDVERIVTEMRFNAEVTVIPISNTMSTDYIFQVGNTIREKRRNLEKNRAHSTRRLETIFKDDEQESTTLGLEVVSKIESDSPEPIIRHEELYSPRTVRMNVLSKDLFSRKLDPVSEEEAQSPKITEEGEGKEKEKEGEEREEVDASRPILMHGRGSERSEVMAIEEEQEENEEEKEKEEEQEMLLEMDDQEETTPHIPLLYMPSLPLGLDNEEETEEIEERPVEISVDQKQDVVVQFETNNLVDNEVRSRSSSWFKRFGEAASSSLRSSPAKEKPLPKGRSSNMQIGEKFASIAAQNIKAQSLFNEVLATHSSGAGLVILNLPLPKKAHHQNPSLYAKLIADLTRPHDRILLVGATGEEMISLDSTKQAMEEDDDDINLPKEDGDQVEMKNQTVANSDDGQV